MTILAIALGGAGGSVLRYLLGGVAQRSSHSGFPFGTLLVNVLGCLLIGILVQAFTNLEPPAVIRGLLVIGFCGGFTTFSAFSNETVGLLAGGEYMKATAYVLLSVALSILTTTAGMGLVRAFSR